MTVVFDGNGNRIQIPLFSHGDVYFPSLFHGGKGIVDDIQKYLLKLATIALNGGETFGYMIMNRDVPVACLLFEEAEHLPDDKLEVDRLQRHIHPLGKTQEAVGNGAASLHIGKERVNVLYDLLFLGKIFRPQGKVLHQAGLLVDNGERIVDLVGYPRGQAADGGHLVCIFHIMEESVALQIRLPDTAYHVDGTPEDHQENENHAADQEPDQITAHGHPVLHEGVTLGNDHQDEGSPFDVGIPQEIGLSFPRMSFQDL